MGGKGKKRNVIKRCAYRITIAAPQQHPSSTPFILGGHSDDRSMSGIVEPALWEYSRIVYDHTRLLYGDQVYKCK